MRKKLLLLLMSIFLVGMLAACGGSTTGGGNSSSGSDSGSDSGDSDTIKIGLNFELSGPVASYGSSDAEGAEFAIEEINANGGILGKKIEVIKQDNKSETQEAVAIATRLTSQDKVLAIIGSATSGNTIAQVQIANDTKTLLLTPSGTAPNVTENEDGSINEYVFRTSYIDPFQGTVAANFALDELGVNTAAIYNDNASDYAKGLADAFRETFEAGGGTIVAEESYVAGDTDFRSTLTNIKSANPEFIFIPGYYEEVGLIVKQARELDITVPLMGADGWDSPKLVELAGAENLNNTFITNHYSSQDPDSKIQDFVKNFEEKYGKSPDSFNALGYDTVYFLADAIERAGNTDPEAIKKALEETENLELVTGTITIDEKHNPVKSATILEYKDGEQTFRTKVDP
jgi:branched-chain amino acid transport system substrate-binding protein